MMTVTIGGKTFEELGITLLKGSNIPILPSTRERTMTIPGKHGKWSFGSEFEPRVFQLECAFITAQNRTDLENQIRELAAHLCDEYGRPMEHKLIFSTEPDRYYTVKYAGSLPIEKLASVGFFSLPLIAYDPIASLVEDTVEEFTWDSQITFENTLRYDDQFEFALTAPITFEVNNFGTMNAAPKIQVTGSFTTFSILDGTRTFIYNEAIASQTLVIDTDKMTVTIGTTNKLSKITGDFIELPVGINNITIGGTSLNCMVSFQLRPRFL